jgi:hypothetical protein
MAQIDNSAVIFKAFRLPFLRKASSEHLHFLKLIHTFDLWVSLVWAFSRFIFESRVASYISKKRREKPGPKRGIDDTVCRWTRNTHGSTRQRAKLPLATSAIKYRPPLLSPILFAVLTTN